ADRDNANHDDEEPAGNAEIDAAIRQDLTEIANLTRQGTAGAAWREYLDWDTLNQAAAADADPQQRRTLARKLLDRLDPLRLSRSQESFVSSTAVAELRTHLRGWAAEPVPVRQLLAHLEQYEYSGLASDGRLVANDFRSLQWSQPEAAESL